MIWALWMFIVGYVRVSIPPEYYESAIKALFENNVIVQRQKKKSNVCFFDVRPENASLVRSLFSNIGCAEIREKARGLKRVIFNYRHRAGLLVGAFIIVAVSFISGRFLWNINITGLQNTTRDDVISLLESHGIYVGCYIPSLDLHSIYNDILIESEDYCWISVNIRGNVANVEVRESQNPAENKKGKSKYANLVASYDGEITSIKTYGGADVVCVGDSVKAGELLTSGIYEDKMGRLKYGYASGAVFAKIKRDFYVEIPLNYTDKQYTGEKTKDVSIKFFSKMINIRNSSRKNDMLYDIIEQNERIFLFDRYELPLSVYCSVYNEYELVEKTRDEQAASSIAYLKIAKDILSAVSDGELISRDYEGYLDGDVYKLKAEVTMNVNIAKTVEFKYEKG